MPDLDRREIADVLKAERERKGLSGAALAKRARELYGVKWDKSEISRLEGSGRKHMSVEKLHVWAGALGMSAEIILWTGHVEPGLVETAREARDPESVELLRELAITLPRMSRDHRDTLRALLKGWRDRR